MIARRPKTFEQVAKAASERLARNVRVRRNLPGDGRLRVDRQLPFLVVYRDPPDRDDHGTRELVTTEAAYLFASGKPEHRGGIETVCRTLVDSMSEHFGLFLLLEIWSMPEDSTIRERERGTPWSCPGFEIVTPETESVPTTIDVFATALESVTIAGHRAEVRVRPRPNVCPPGLDPLLPDVPGDAGHCFSIGLAVRPVYRDRRTGTPFPVVLRELRRQLAPAMRRAIHTFIGADHPPEETVEGEVRDGPSRFRTSHHEALGPTGLVKAARLVDQRLGELGESFDFLLQVTPVNADDAYREFVAGNAEIEPTLYYRPCPHDPALLKRRLYDIPIERVEDVTLAQLFWQKQDELDRQITAIRDIDTRQFLYTSLQLYGGVDDALDQLATTLLDRVARLLDNADAESNEDDAGSSDEHAESNGRVGAHAVAERARDEIDYYHAQLPSFSATVEVCDHIAAGIMVAHGKLLVADTLQLRPERVAPLLHHEVGTHLVTFYNGRNQPFRQLANGLAGYESLQEGLAVLAEYLVGGLSLPRMRTLAARVVAVRAMTDGATFVETYRRLVGNGLPQRSAFTTTLRVHRAGGLTKDAIYLRGLRDLLAHLRDGHEIEPLYVGKIALEHVPFVQELRRRGIVQPPAVLPRFWGEPGHRDRLERCRQLHVPDLLEG